MLLPVSFVLMLSLYSGPLTAQAVAVGQPNKQTQTASSGTPFRISVSFENTPLADALWTIARRSGSDIALEESLLLNKKVSYHADNITPEIAFAAILKGTPFKVSRVQNGKLVLVDTKVRNIGQAQGVIAGRVTDAKTGKGVPGATVFIGKYTRGSTTAEDGSYRLTGISAGTYTVSVRLVGYAKQSRSLTLGEGSTVAADFKLEPSANVLDQVIVTGTIVATELKTVPSAITVITAKQIEQRGITRIDQLFRGEIPGLFSLEIGASPSSSGYVSLDEVVMYSRGATRISTSGNNATAATNPIKTYVDGVELADPRYLSQIDPKSIERIEILTGPQASTVYGAGAVNGVMQIFTKRGNTAKPVIMLSLSEGLAQSNQNSALSPSHQYDGSMSGIEGKFSYNINSGWNYTGAWTPNKQTQRASVSGGGRYQTGSLSLDLSARQGWTHNKLRGSNERIFSTGVESGRFTVSGGGLGLSAPYKNTLSGRTFGVTLGYTPLAWWSHQLNMGTDAADIQVIGSAAGLSFSGDTNYFNSQTPNVRMSQSYSSTVRIPFSSLAQATLTYGGDHWRTRTSDVSWTVTPSGSLADPSVTRTRPGKNSGGYVQGQLGINDALFLTYGVRADWNPNYGEKAKVRPGRYGASYSKEVGGISAKLRVSYGRSITPPSEGQKKSSPVLPITASNAAQIAVFADPGSPLYSNKPNPELGSEFQQGGEGGIELYFGNRGSLVLTRYNQTVDGLISTVPGVDSVRAIQPGFNPSSGTTLCDAAADLRSDGYCYRTQSQNLNVGSIRNQGWELQSSISTGPFTTRATYSWTKSRVIGVTQRYRGLLTNRAFTPGNAFNFVPEHTWFINTTYVRSGTSISLNVNGLGQVLSDPINAEINLAVTDALRLRTEEAYRFNLPLSSTGFRLAQPGYTTANMNASQRFSDRLESTLQITNLTNYYQNDFSFRYPTIGRQTKLGIRMRW